MKFNTILIIIFVFSFNHLTAQNIVWGETQRTNDAFKISDFFHSDDKFIYALQSPQEVVINGFEFTNKVVLQKYDIKSMNLVKTEKIDFNSDISKRKFVQLLKVKEGKYILSYKYDKKAKQLTYFVQKINLKTLKAEGKLTAIIEINNSKETDPFFLKVAISNDKSKIAIVNGVKSKRDVDRYVVQLFDNNFNELGEAEKVCKNEKEEDYMFIDLFVSNDGNIFLSTLIKIDNGYKNYKYFLHQWLNQAKSYSKSTLKIKGKSVISAKFVSVDNKLKIIGSFGSSGNVDKTLGFYICDVVRAEKCNNYLTHNIEGSIIRESLKNRNKIVQKLHKEKEGLENMYLADVILNENKSISVVLEKYIWGKFQGKVYYEYKSAIVFNFEKDLLLNWNTVILKDLKGERHMVNGYYVLHNYNNKLYFVHNVMPEKTKIVMLVYALDYKVSVIDENGKLTEQIVTKGKEGKFLLFPRVSYVSSKGEVFLSGSYNRKYQLGKLIVK